MKTDLEIVDEVIELLSAPERWCRDYCAIDSEGRGVSVYDDTAVAFCLFGAFSKSGFGQGYHVARSLVPDGDALAPFNNDPETTHIDIMTLLQKTRESLCK